MAHRRRESWCTTHGEASARGRISRVAQALCYEGAMAMLGAKDFDVTRLQGIWSQMSAVPMGKQLFSRAAGFVAPYTATIGAQVQDFEPGYARVSMEDRRAVRNHLRCVHAVALVNLAEMTGNLALIAAMPKDARMIVRGMNIEYLKKARGKLVATGKCPVPNTSAKQDIDVTVEIADAKGEVVARAMVKSMLSPKKA
jgi:uncharacterized protein (TIGR00369 family)